MSTLNKQTHVKLCSVTQPVRKNFHLLCSRIHAKIFTYIRGSREISDFHIFYQAMRNTADMTGGVPNAV
jgi:hypothetical protein